MSESQTIKQETLLEHFYALPTAEQYIVQVLAVIYTPVNQTNLQNILKLLMARNPDIFGITSSASAFASLAKKPLREKLIKQGLLVRASSQRFHCDPDFADTLLPIINEADLILTIHNASDTIISAWLGTKRGWYHSRPSSDYTADERRKQRIAFYLHQEDELLKILKRKTHPYKIADPYNLNKFREVYQKYSFTQEKEWKSKLPLSIQFQLLAPQFIHANNNFTSHNDEVKNFIPKLYALAEQEAEIAYIMAEWLILKGDFKEAEDILPQNEYSKTLAFKAWLAYMRGEREKALDLYTQSHKKLCQETSKRKIYMGGLVGLFFILALLEKDTTATKKQLRTQLNNALSVSTDDHFIQSIRYLDDATAILQGDKKLASAAFLNQDTPRFEPATHLIITIALHWISAKPKHMTRQNLKRAFKQSQESDNQWYRWQSLKIFSLLNINIDKLSDKAEQKSLEQRFKNTPDLCQLVKVRAPWEITLDSIDQFINNSATISAKNTNDTLHNLRMVWWFNSDNYLSLEPREQKRSKNGRWTKGRPVALKRLYQERTTFDYLSEQDQRICNQIREENYTFRGYPRTDYHFDTQQALTAAIGHPLLFDAANPSLPISLITGKPSLHLQKAKNTLKIQLKPFPNEEGIEVQKEGKQSYRVVHFSQTERNIANMLGEKGLSIPFKAKERVLSSINKLAPLITVQSDIAGAIAHPDIEKIPPLQRFQMQLEPVGDGLKFSAYSQVFESEQPLFRPGEGGKSVFTELKGKQVQTERDLAAERKAFKDLLKHCPHLYFQKHFEWYLEEPEEALETLMQLQSLQILLEPEPTKKTTRKTKKTAKQTAAPQNKTQYDLVLTWPQGKKINLTQDIDVGNMNLTVRKKQNWFDLNGELKLDDGQVLEMQTLLALLEETPGRFIQLGDGQFLSLTEQLRKRLRAMQDYTNHKGQFHNLATPVMDELFEGMPLKASKPWKDQLKRLQESQNLSINVPTTLQAELRDYQREGFDWLARLAHWGAGACLADDMGLGKTLQALALILLRAENGPTLVLAPTSVCSNWESETYRFAPTLNVKRFGKGDRQAMLDQAAAFDLIVCSYGLLQSEADRLQAVSWHTIVVDEAQAIKNSQTKRSQAAMKLNADFRMITTGTPIENHLGELWNLFRFINPGLLGSKDQFNTRFATPIERDDNAQARQSLKNLLTPFILRRLKSDVLTELPARTEITLHVELSTEEMAFYEALRQQALENMALAADENPGAQRIKMLAEITRLRLACCHPQLVMPESALSSSKLNTLLEVIEELRENNHRALVFSQFVKHLSLVRKALDKQGISYQYLDGSTSVKKRQEAISAFQSGQGDLFLISLKAGGSGLNLTAADYVIHLDPWWNPAVEDQASDRAHRIGQKRPVTIYRLVTQQTIEEKIVALHQQKRDLADSLLEGTEMGSKLSVDDILAMIKESTTETTTQA